MHLGLYLAPSPSRKTERSWSMARMDVGGSKVVRGGSLSVRTSWKDGCFERLAISMHVSVRFGAFGS